MPLFCCSKCGCVENTAACNYHLTADKTQALCAECDPKIGQWHGLFEKRSAVGMLVDQNGHLWRPESVAAGGLPPTYRIIGEVVPDLESDVGKLIQAGRDLGMVITSSYRSK